MEKIRIKEYYPKYCINLQCGVSILHRAGDFSYDQKEPHPRKFMIYVSSCIIKEKSVLDRETQDAKTSNREAISLQFLTKYLV